MEQYNVTGMSCAACAARVEKAVKSVEGVSACAVSLLTNSMGVEGGASAESVIKAVEAAGYGASLKKGEDSSRAPDYSESLEDKETPKLIKRLTASVIILIPLMYVSMGHMMWSWPLPSFMHNNPVAVGLYELLLSALVMIINQKFFISGFKGLVHRSPNMDTLVALGATASFCYSVYALFAMTGAVQDGNSSRISYFMNQFYFESAAMILTLITIGKTLEARSKGKTTNALKALMKLSPDTAVILVDGKETEVTVDKVKKGDKFVVRPGSSIAVDGIVLEGQSAVNEAAITGESVPVEKGPGDEVTAATMNTSGYLVCRAERVGQDTTLAGIIRMVSDAAATKAPIAKIADKVSGVFVPSVIAVSFITFIVWLLLGKDLGYVISRAVSVLVISCPCSLGLATPVAIMVGNGVAAKNGILFKTSQALEQVGKTKIAALDKTGTITTGTMQVTDVIPFGDYSAEELIKLAGALEAKSEHPIAGAITKYAAEQAGDSAKIIEEICDFKAVPGNGLSGTLNGKKITGGNMGYFSQTVTLRNEAGTMCKELTDKMEKLSREGKTPVIFAADGQPAGIIAVADSIKQDSAKAIEQLKKMGIHVVMLTGDNRITAEAIAEKAGVDEVAAGIKPGEKEEVIRKLMETGNVTMIGDGINDAPALTRADTGIAIGAGTDIAMDAADVVLMKSSLMDVVKAIRISRSTITNIHENLFWAFFYNVIGIPLAAGCFVKLLGWSLNPMFGAAAMGLSSFCVVSNALRLNFIKVNSSKHDKCIKKPVTKALLDKFQEKEGGKMEITVNGMMCSHCEAHVKKALEEVDGIVSASADHEKNLVKLETSKPVEEELIKKAVTDAGYEYAGIKA